MTTFPTGPAVTLVNRSSLIADGELAPVAAALQRQLEEHFAPAWGFTASVLTTPSTEEAPDWAWWIVLLDDADTANVLGYHELTASGRPLSKVFARDCAAYRVPWSAVASHELLEMLADPGINLTAFNWPDRNGYLYAVEVCDAVNSVRYPIDGVEVADFLYPSWFRIFDPDNDGPYDHAGACSSPFELAFGGFQIYVVWGTSGWRFATRGRTAAAATDPPKGSRRERRIRGQHYWRVSAAR